MRLYATFPAVRKAKAGTISTMISGKQRMPLWANLLFFVFGSFVWVFNGYKMVTALTSMGILDAVCAGMILLFGPFMLWESFQSIRKGG